MAQIGSTQYSPLPFPGSDPGTTQSEHFSLRVPTAAGAANPLEPPFVHIAEDTLSSIQQILRRMRDLTAFFGTDAFNDANGWTMLNTPPNNTKVRIVGEVWGYGQFSVQRTGGVVSVPDDGNLVPQEIGTLADTALLPRSLARLSTVNTGVAGVGHVASDGIIYLDAINSGDSIQTGAVITLAGMWPLLNGFDSEA